MKTGLIICFLGWLVLGYSQNSGSIGVPGDYPEGGTDDQTISISNDTIFLEDGGFVVVPGGGGGDNLFSADLTQTENRSHDSGGNIFTWNGISTLNMEANAMNISTDVGDYEVTAAGNMTYTSGNTTNFGGPGSITFSSGTGAYWLFGTPPTDNTEDQILAYDASGRLELRDVSTIGASDGLGSSPTTGAILFGQGTTTAAIDASNLFWDNTLKRLGIGTVSPSASLEVFNASGSNIILSRTNAGSLDPVDITTDANADGVRIISGTGYSTSNSAIQFWNSSATFKGIYLDAASTSDIIFRSGGTEHMRMTTGGNVGIGTTTFGTSASGVIGLGNGTAPTTSPADVIQIYAKDVAGSSELAVMDEAGNETILSDASTETIVTLASDFSTATTANSSVTDFFFTPEANKTYLVRGYFLVRTAVTTTGPRPGMSFPTGVTDAGTWITAPNSLTARVNRNQGTIVTHNAASTGLPTTADSYLATLEALIIVGGSPSGNVQITLASENTGSVTMKAGSKLIIKEI